MGKRGPARTPTAILKLRGSWRAKLRRTEPEPEVGAPSRPKWLRAEARKAWDKLIPQLERMGVIGTCDANALARYCQLWARWRSLETYLEKGGAAKDCPQAITAGRLAETLLRLEREFGLTPSARASLARPKEEPNENRGKDRFFVKRA